MVREKVLDELEKNRGKQISGEQIAKNIGVSRAAVWKAINLLKKNGMDIKSTTGGGYCLNEDDDTLNIESIKSLCKCKYIANDLIILQEVSSTNTILKQNYFNKNNGFVLIAEKQTSGKGRMGRKFNSPSGGAYISILLKPNCKINDLSFLTLLAAVAVCSAIEKCTNIKPQIKWVNDIIINNKKICGILTEASIEGETGNIENIIVGIGINIKTDISKMPEDVKPIATSLAEICKNPPRRAVVIAEILNFFEKYYDIFLKENGKNKILALYTQNLCCINKKIHVYSSCEKYEAICKGINKNGNLIVVKTNGKTQILKSGEIRIIPENFIKK